MRPKCLVTPVSYTTDKCKYIETKIDHTELIIAWQPHKQTNKQANQERNKQVKENYNKNRLWTWYMYRYVYSSNSRQWKKVDEVCCCVSKNVENTKMFAKGFIQHRYCGFLFISLFLYSLCKVIGKRYKRYLRPK